MMTEKDKEGGRVKRQQSPRLSLVFSRVHFKSSKQKGAAPRSLTVEYGLENTPGLCQIPTNDFSA